MKVIKYLLLSAFTLCSLAVSAQDEAAAAPAAKKKAEKPAKVFTVYEKGSRVSRVGIAKDAKGAGNIIVIEAQNVTGGSVVMSRGAQPVLPAPEITQIESIRGSYGTTRTTTQTGRSLTVQLQEVVFPYRGRLTISEQTVDFEITEPGYWKVSVSLSQ